MSLKLWEAIKTGKPFKKPGMPGYILPPNNPENPVAFRLYGTDFHSDDWKVEPDDFDHQSPTELVAYICRDKNSSLYGLVKFFSADLIADSVWEKAWLRAIWLDPPKLVCHE